MTPLLYRCTTTRFHYQLFCSLYVFVSLSDIWFFSRRDAKKIVDLFSISLILSSWYYTITYILDISLWYILTTGKGHKLTYHLRGDKKSPCLKLERRSYWKSSYSGTQGTVFFFALYKSRCISLLLLLLFPASSHNTTFTYNSQTTESGRPPWWTSMSTSDSRVSTKQRLGLISWQRKLW